jgi:hypothetical protein
LRFGDPAAIVSNTSVDRGRAEPAGCAGHHGTFEDARKPCGFPQWVWTGSQADGLDAPCCARCLMPMVLPVRRAASGNGPSGRFISESRLN